MTIASKTIHPSGIRQEIVDKVVARRGRLHAFDSITSRATALVVVDMDSASVSRIGDDAEIERIVGVVNRLAQTLRATGGTVCWVMTPTTKMEPRFRALYGNALAARYEHEDDGMIWPGLHAEEDDVKVVKTGYSAFFPGKCDLHSILSGRSVSSLLIAGLVTNVCCEASARDASEAGYEVTMVSDALQGHDFGLHEASLATFFRNYGDVRPSSEIENLLLPAAAS